MTVVETAMAWFLHLAQSASMETANEQGNCASIAIGGGNCESIPIPLRRKQPLWMILQVKLIMSVRSQFEWLPKYQFNDCLVGLWCIFVIGPGVDQYPYCQTCLVGYATQCSFWHDCCWPLHASCVPKWLPPQLTEDPKMNSWLVLQSTWRELARCDSESHACLQHTWGMIWHSAGYSVS